MSNKNNPVGERSVKDIMRKHGEKNRREHFLRNKEAADAAAAKRDLEDGPKPTNQCLFGWCTNEGLSDGYCPGCVSNIAEFGVCPSCGSLLEGECGDESICESCGHNPEDEECGQKRERDEELEEGEVDEEVKRARRD